MSSPENLPNAAPQIETQTTPVNEVQELHGDTPKSLESNPGDENLTKQQEEYIDYYLRERLGELSQALEQAAMMVLNAQPEKLSNIPYWQSEVAPQLRLSPEDVNELIEFVKLVIKERGEAELEDQALTSEEADQANEPPFRVGTEDIENDVVRTTPDAVSEPPTQM